MNWTTFHLGCRAGRRLAGFAAGFALAWLGLGVPAATAREVRVATYNILNGTGAVGSPEYEALWLVLDRIDADIVCFQELYENSYAAWTNLAAELGYAYTAMGGNNPSSDSLFLGYFSRFPIRATHAVESPPGANELARLPFRAVVEVPDAQRPLVLWTMHHKASSGSIDKFRRAVEAQRICQDVDAYLAANPDQVDYVLTGDMNEDIRDAQTPAQFSSQPAGAPSYYALGADIAFPVAYATFPTHRYADAGAGLIHVPATWENSTTPVTRPSSGRQLDYIFLSPDIVGNPLGAPQSEVYYSEADAGGGLPKRGDPLPAGTSAAASDHLAVFVDFFVADFSAVLPTAGFFAAGEVGGPFEPEFKTYTFTETNAFSTTWTATTDVAWLSVDAGSFTLNPFEPFEVDVFLNENAAALPPGTHAGAIAFSNETTGLLETRAVELTVRDPLAVAPADGWVAEGIVGGPFHPDSKTFVVTNKSAQSMAFTAAANQNWLTVAPASGLLPGGQSVEVTAALNANALGLPIGVHADTLVFSNQTTGLAETRPVSLSILGQLCDAVDACDLAWTTGGDAAWFHQTASAADGSDAARSGPLAASQQTWMETTVAGPLRISFQWRVSSRTNAHYLRFLDNGAVRDQISGETDWAPRSYELAAGIHTLRWEYVTSATAPQGSNAGWVDQVALDYFSVSPDSPWYASGRPGGPFSPGSREFVLTNSGPDPLQWTATPDVAWIAAEATVGELPPGGSATVGFTLDTNATPMTLGTYPAAIVFSNQTTGRSLSRAVTLSTLGALCEAVEGCALVWTTGGNANWFHQTTNTFDGSDAAQSGPIGASQQSWIETTVTGPAQLRFQWRVSSRSSHYLRFQIDGTNQASIGGETGWTQRTFAVAAGTHALRWVFTNSTTTPQGVNAGWLDQVALDTFAVTPTNVWHASGFPGGPFAPATRLCTLTNAGPDALSWTAAASANWISIAPGAGTLAPGTGTNVDLALAANASLLPAGLYSAAVVFSNQASGRTITNSAVLDTRGSLCEAVDFCGLEWSSGGSIPWFHQTTNAADGSDAAQSGPLAASQHSWLETVVAGPVHIRFQWRASSLTNAHYLRFADNGTVQYPILSGETGWVPRSYEVPPGRHVLRWSFTNTTAAAAGANAAWVDQVSFEHLTAWPMDAWIASGLPGGPFVPDSRTYVVTNSGAEVLHWSVTQIANWITVAPTNGVLAPGEGAAVEMSLNELANAYTLGTHSGFVTFSNATTGATFLRQVNLVVQDSLAIAPSSAFHTGYVGGPYSPATRTFVLSNTSAEAVGWSVLVRTNGFAATTRTNWVTPVPASGIVEPGQTQSVVVSFNENTAGLSAAMHYVRLAFYNETTELTQDRYLYLTLQDALAVLAADWNPAGPAGGPFVPASTTYVLTNRTTAATPWSVSCSAPWLALDKSGGTLASNSAVAVAASLNAEVAALPVGFHTAAVVFSNLTQGVAITQTVSLAVGIAFCEALEACGFDWTLGGNANWLYQTNVAQDGIDAAASGTIADSQETWMQTTVAGPGTVSFWWKISSEQGWDYLEFWLDGALTNRISGEVNWQSQSLALGSGAHVLRWRYAKDSSATNGSDRAWVDGLAWAPARTALGVPIVWYERFGLAPAPGGTWDELDLLPSAAGPPNWFQFVAGLTPTNPADHFRIETIELADGQPTRILWWGGTNGPGEAYVVESTPTMEPSLWQPVGSIPRAAGLNVWTNPSPAESGQFFRIRATPDAAP